MLHIHFGAARLGIGLIAPFFQKPGSELHLLNRAVSGANATGSTGLSATRRNELLRDHPERHYSIRKPAGSDSDGRVVRYDRFFPFAQGDVPAVVRTIARESSATTPGTRGSPGKAHTRWGREAILRRPSGTEDTISRILARFRAPTPEDSHTIEAFNNRLGDRVDPPLEAYAAEHGMVPPAASRSLLNLHRLLAAGHFVDAGTQSR